MTYISAPLTPARDPLLAAREKTHGDFGQVAEIAQKLKAIFRSAPNWERLDPAQREALEMKATKLARHLCGDAANPEHLRDDAGYAALILERLPRRLPERLPEAKEAIHKNGR